MARNAKLILGIGILALMLVAIAFYGYMQSRRFLSGPQITIMSPKNGESVKENPVTVAGVVKNLSYITLDDNPIFADSKGNFSEKLLLLPGYNIITVRAEDRFGKETEKTLELVYKIPEKETPATSSPPSTL